MKTPEEIFDKALQDRGINRIGLQVFGAEIYEAGLDAIKQALTIPDVRQQRELLDEFCSTMEFDVKHETYEEDIDYFLENVKADNCAQHPLTPKRDEGLQRMWTDY